MPDDLLDEVTAKSFLDCPKLVVSVLTIVDDDILITIVWLTNLVGWIIVVVDPVIVSFL